MVRIRDWMKTAIHQDALKAYYFVTNTRIGTLHNVEELAEQLRLRFTEEKTLVHDRQRRTVISEIRSVVPELLFRADTLSATISPTRATLFQQHTQPFTPRDLALRRQILQWYPAQTFLPGFRKEPPYTIASDDALTPPSLPPPSASQSQQPLNLRTLWSSTIGRVLLIALILLGSLAGYQALSSIGNPESALVNRAILMYRYDRSPPKYIDVVLFNDGEVAITIMDVIVNGKHPYWEADNPTVAPSNSMLYRIQYNWTYESSYTIHLVSERGSMFGAPWGMLR
jgi:hypothetical protein